MKRFDVALWLARRLSLKEGAIGQRRIWSPGVIVAVAAVALSVCVMIISIAVVTGFREEITAKVSGFEQQITITADRSGFMSEPYVEQGIRLTDSLQEAIRNVVGNDAVVDVTLRQPAILKTDTEFQGVVIKGIPSGGSDEAFITPQITDGGMFNADSLNSIAVSRHTAEAIGVAVGDRVFVHFFIGDNLLTRRLKIAAIFDTHFSDYDKLMAYAPLRTLQNVVRVDSLTGTTVDINRLQPDKIDRSVDKLRFALTDYAANRHENLRYHVAGIHETGALYFSWLALIDTNVIVILVLMSCVAGFTLISSLLVIILQRIPTIGILKAMGADDKLLRRTFIAISSRLALAGILLGNLVALGIIFVQSRFHLIGLDPESYYLNFVPVRVNFATIAVLDIAVAVLCLLLMLIPSRMIASLNPADTMRYE